MNDVLGRKLQSGDIVTYPVRQRSDMWVCTGLVLAVTEDGLKIMKLHGEPGRHVTVTESQRVTLAIRGADVDAALAIAGIVEVA